MARGVAWGDVRLVEFGRPDKTRPAVVLTRTSATSFLNAITVAPVTRTIRGIPTEVRLDVEEGLKGPSAATLDAVQTVSAERIGRYLGSVGRHRRREFREALLFALDLSQSDLS
ncbi:MAG: type II toxin-antitoxin system PemK/MazF family toxin [Myxococcota bacterium]